jgi:hypothetical protein
MGKTPAPKNVLPGAIEPGFCTTRMSQRAISKEFADVARCKTQRQLQVLAEECVAEEFFGRSVTELATHFRK